MGLGVVGPGWVWAGEDRPAGSDQAAAGADAASLWCRLIDSRGGEARKTTLHAAARGGIDLHLKPPYFLAQGKEVRFERPSLSPAIRTLYLSIYLSCSLSLSLLCFLSLPTATTTSNPLPLTIYHHHYRPDMFC